LRIAFRDALSDAIVGKQRDVEQVLADKPPLARTVAPPSIAL